MPDTQIKVLLTRGRESLGRYVLKTGAYLVGRDPACDIVVDCADVSQRHARLSVTPDEVRYEDLGSSNGSFVAGERINAAIVLRLPQQVRLGSVVLEIDWAKSSETGDGGRKKAVVLSREEALRVGEHYRASTLVARGGMGSIHEAEDLHLGRTVAMKRLLSGGSSSPESRQRFLREAEILGRLEHPNIVPVHDLGIDEKGELFYTMKFVKGVTLHRVLDEIKAGKAETIAKYPLAVLLTIFQKVCDAISFAHSKGIVHRDLKPENVMLGDFGEVLVMDWGLAKVVRTSSSPKDLISRTTNEDDGDPPGNPAEALSVNQEPDIIKTLEGRIMGTPNFMALEQAEGRIADIDARTDIYALGGILYNLMTLSPPVSGASLAEVLEQIGRGTIRPPSSFNQKSKPRQARCGPSTPDAAAISLPHCPGRRIPEALSAVAMKALAREPERRYQTVAELQKDVAAFQGGFATSAEQAGAWRLLTLAIKRRKTEFSLAGAALLIIIALVTAFMLKVTSTLAELRRTTPALQQQTLALIEEKKFDEALQRISYALSLKPDEADYVVLKGNILQSLLRLSDARDAYTRVLKLKPSHFLAEQNRQLCEKLLAKTKRTNELAPENLEELRAAMLAQGRSAEAIALAQKISQQTQDSFSYWQDALNKAGWKGTMTKDEKNRLQFVTGGDNAASDLSPFRGMPLSQLVLNPGKVSDLSPLQGMLLDRLEIWNGELIKDLIALKGMPLVTFTIDHSPLSNITPLKGMPLRFLALQHCTNLTDLRPLRGMKLEQLRLYTTYLTDLNPLQGMSLTHFDIVTGPNLSDLNPLRGMPLTYVRLEQCPKITDISSLEGMPLTSVQLAGTQVEDISVLRGMKLTVLGLTQTKVIDFSPIKGMPLVNLDLTETKFSDMSLLKDMPLNSLGLFRTRVTDLSVLQGMRLESLNLFETKVQDLGPIVGMPLHSFQAAFTPILDISPLKGAPLTDLDLSHTRVSDIGALKGTPVIRLAMNDTPIHDVGALAGAPVELLSLNNTPVTDISGLRGSPLKALRLDNCRKLQDLSPLVECKQLEYLSLPPLHKDIEFLRTFPKLKRLGYAVPQEDLERMPSPAEFWKAYDARKK